MTRRILVPLIALVALAVGISPAGARKPPEEPVTTGTGTVFLPNPVADLQNQDLTDRKDADYAELQPAYHTVTLTNLDGSGYLVGDWANIRGSTGDEAFEPDATFDYDRHDDRFEQVMGYYWVTQAQLYIQSLGFGVDRPAINKESQDVRVNQLGYDNSFSWDKKDLLRFGKGGVDDAEDAEVILHEYGHAIHDSQVPGFGEGNEAGAIGEGFADYWAVTVTEVVSPTPDPACVADWDAVSYTDEEPHCLRRVDEDLHYPEDLVGRVHADGRIWSRALWDMRNALGGSTADTIILDAQFDFAPDTTMPAAARATVDSALANYGTSTAAVVEAAFEARGIL